MAEYITREEFDKFLEELSVVLADEDVNPRFAWNHYDSRIYNLKSKKNLLKKGVNNGNTCTEH